MEQKLYNFVGAERMHLAKYTKHFPQNLIIKGFKGGHLESLAGRHLSSIKYTKRHANQFCTKLF